MKYQLISEITYPPLTQIFVNRGIPASKVDSYIQANENDINEPERLDENKIKQGVKLLLTNVKNNTPTAIIVDPDVDGNTASALLLNYLHILFPTWTESIRFYVHDGKQHGLNDCVKQLLSEGYKFFLVPDAGSNDTEACKKIVDEGGEVLILDHHDFDKENQYATIINNQDGYSNYPNKFLSGVGVVWQFCRYIDKLNNTDHADNFRDLVAIGLVGDMMDLREIETSYLVHNGLKNINNPLIYGLAKKNEFKLGDNISPIGAAFYIVPLINAVQRSGTQDEKELIFQSMLSYKAFEEIPSTKRGHNFGEMERRVDQAVRQAGNVKNRQTRIQDKSLETLEKKIEDEHLLDHKALLLLLDDDNNIPAEVRGLIANKFMAKYQRPCCLLTKGDKNGVPMYQGSARGCSLAGVDDFKQICQDSNAIEYAVGHPNAFGLGIPVESVDDFIAKTDASLADMTDEPQYYVDFIFDGQHIDEDTIYTIANMEEFWGQNMDEPYIAIKGLKVTADMVDVYEKATNTIKITLNNKITIMKFKATMEECNKLKYNNNGFVEIDLVGRAHQNNYNGNVSAQVITEAYNIIDSNEYYF